MGHYSAMGLLLMSHTSVGDFLGHNRSLGTILSLLCHESNVPWVTVSYCLSVCHGSIGWLQDNSPIDNSPKKIKNKIGKT